MKFWVRLSLVLLVGGTVASVSSLLMSRFAWVPPAMLAVAVIGLLLMEAMRGPWDGGLGTVLVGATALFVVGSLIWSGVAVLFVVPVAAPPPQPELWKVLSASAAVIAFGILVGVAELVGRYVDEPARALTTWPAFLYFGLNGTVAFLAFAMVRKHPEWVSQSLSGLIVSGVVAGFGAMTALRSKVFTIHLGDGKEVSVGPVLVVEVLLKVLDRAVDRVRADERLALITKAIDELKLIPLLEGRSLAVVEHFFTMHVNGFQNLTEDEKSKFFALLKQYTRNTEWPAHLVVAGIAYFWLDLAGERYWRQCLESLARTLEQTAPGEAPVVPGP